MKKVILFLSLIFIFVSCGDTIKLVEIKDIKTSIINNKVYIKIDNINSKALFKIKRNGEYLVVNNNVLHKENTFTLKNNSVTFIDSTCKENKLYSYKISFSYKENRVIYNSNVKEVKKSILSNKVKNFNVSKDKENVRISWDTILGDVSYFLIRKNLTNKDIKVLKLTKKDLKDTNLNTNYYLDTTCKEYTKYEYSIYYEIKKNNNTFISKTSKKEQGFILLDKVKKLKASSDKTYVELSFDNIENANFIITRKNLDDNKVIKIDSSLLEKEDDKLILNDKSLITGIDYEYSIFYEKDGFKSQIEKIKAKILPEAVKNLKAEFKTNICLTWDKVDNATYYIKRNDEKLFTVNTNSFTDSSIEDNKIYSYCVYYSKDVNDKTIESEKLFIKINSYIIKNLTASNDEVYIKLSFDNIKNAKFYITRKEKNTNTLTTIDSSLLKEEGDKLVLIDKTCKEKTSYVYSISFEKDNDKSKFYYIEGYAIEKSINNLKSVLSENEIKLTWQKIDDCSYNIKRTNLNDNTIKIIDNPNLIESSDLITFIDTTCVSGVEYEYGICSVKQNGEISKETFIKSSMLSLPKNIKVIKENGKYKLTSDKNTCFENEENKNYYIIKNIYYYDLKDKIDYNQSIKTASNIKIEITKDKTALDYDLSYYPAKFTIGIENTSLEQTFDYDKAVEDITISVSENNYFDKEAKNGVYPVQIKWDKQGGAVYRSENGKNDFVFIGKTDENVFYDDTCKLTKKYDYCVRPMSICNKLGKKSDIATGYSAITDELYFKLVDHYAIHIWYYDRIKRPDINEKVDKGGLSSIGTASIKGNKTGSIFYEAKAKGFSSGIVTFKYKDFSDYPWLIVNDEYSMSANLSKNGKLNGKLKTTGMYSGTIKFEDLKIESGIGKGEASVKQENREEGKVNMLGDMKSKENEEWSIDNYEK